MTNEAQILVRIAAGDWASPLLFPLLISDLKKRLNSSFTTVTSSSLEFYGHGREDIGSDRFVHKFPDRFLKTAFGSHVTIGTFSDSQKSAITAAQTSACNLWPETRPCITNVDYFVRVLKLSALGASHPHAMGTIFYGDALMSATTEQLQLSIVHELGHQELFLINLVDRLVAPGQDSVERLSPLQQKHRPTIGRLHALAALARMIRIQIKARRSTKILHHKFAATAQTFAASDLTSFGMKLVTAYEQSVQIR